MDLVCAGYSSEEDDSEKRKQASRVENDVNYDNVVMDMGSSCEDSDDQCAASEGNGDQSTKDVEKGESLDLGLFSSKDEYKAYQNQFESRSGSRGRTDKQEKEIQENANEYGKESSSEYGGCNPVNAKKCKLDTETDEYGGMGGEKDEYGSFQPKPKNINRESSPVTARGPHSRDNSQREEEVKTGFLSRKELNQR